MTGSSNSNDGEPEQPEAATGASSTAPSEPVQLDLFELRTGKGRDTTEPLAPSASPVATEALPIFAHWAALYRRKAIGHDRFPWAAKRVTCGTGRSLTPNCRSKRSPRG